MVKSYSISPVAKTFNLRIEVSELSFVRIAPWLLYVYCASRKQAWFLRFFKVSIDYLFGNLVSGKETIALERKSEKSLEFWTQKSARTLSYLQDLWRKEVFRKLDHLIHINGSVTLSGLKTKNRRTLQ